MLTDQQIEAAARKLCELRGIDPDIIAWKPSNAPHMTYWEMAAQEIRLADQVHEAIAAMEEMRAICTCGHSVGHHSWTSGSPTYCERYVECECKQYVPAFPELSAPQGRG